MRWFCALLISGAALQLGFAQVREVTTSQTVTATPRHDAVHQVDPSQMYHRVYARVPMIGTGRRGDELRPMFAPLPSQVARDHTGILAYQMQISDDRKWALVEFVGATPKDLQAIISSTDPNVKVFERGKHGQDEIEADFKNFKKDFTLSSFATRAQ
jgi:hypothetical protein